MKTQFLAFSQFGMIGSSQVGQEPGEAHMLPWRVGRQSEFATYALSDSSPLAPRAQGEKLPMHQFSSLEVKAKDDTCGGQVARNTIS